MKPRPPDKSGTDPDKSLVFLPEHTAQEAQWPSDGVKRRLNYGEGARDVEISPEHENGGTGAPVEQILKTLHMDEAAQAEARVSQLEDICVSLEAGSARLAQLEGYNLQLEAEKTILEEKVKSLEEETGLRLGSLQDLVKVQEEKGKQSTAEIATLREQVSKLQAENTKLLSSEKGHCVQIASTTSRCKALEAEMIELVKKKEAAEGKVSHLQHEVEALKSGASVSRSSGRSLSADSRAPVAGVTDALSAAEKEARVEQESKRVEHIEKLRSELVEAHARAEAAESRAIAANHSADTIQRHLEDQKKQNSIARKQVAALEAAQSAAIQDLCAQGKVPAIVGRQLAHSLQMHQEAAMSQEDVGAQQTPELSSLADMLAQVAVKQQLMAQSLATMRQMQHRGARTEEDDFRDTSTTRSFSFSPERGRDVETQRGSPELPSNEPSTTMSDRVQTVDQQTTVRHHFGGSESSNRPEIFAATAIVDSV